MNVSMACDSTTAFNLPYWKRTRHRLGLPIKQQVLRSIPSTGCVRCIPAAGSVPAMALLMREVRPARSHRQPSR